MWLSIVCCDVRVLSPLTSPVCVTMRHGAGSIPDTTNKLRMYRPPSHFFEILFADFMNEFGYTNTSSLCVCS